MSALDRYLWLESTGIWREGAGAAPREVVVRFGQATLLLSDAADRLLGHWALAGIQVVGEADGATVYAMTAEGDETLAIRDAEMIAAIAEVSHGPIEAPPLPAPPRRRFPFIGVAVTLAAAAVLAAFGPEALREQAIRMVPVEQTEELGDRMLLGLMDLAGGPCLQPAGRRALDRVAARVAGDSGPPLRLHVLSLGTAPAAALPGRTVLLDRSAVGEAEAPAEIAGWIALALGRDPVAALMAAAGPLGDLRYILTGQVGPHALARGTEAALAPPAPGEAEAAMERLAASGIDPGPFAEALQRQGIAAEAPATPEPPGPPILRDQDWVALQGICG
jgi:hypothetical protein